MSIETDKEKICINHIVNQKKETFIVKGDCIIPDIKPDILKEINTSGIICVYKKEVTAGKLKIDGNINTYTIYLADDETNRIRSINFNLDFSQIITIDNATPEMEIKLETKLKNIECKILNERKISITAFVEADIKAISNEEVTIIDKVNIPDIQLQESKLKISSNVGTGNVTAYAKDTLVIDTAYNLAEIMKIEANIIDKDIKLSYNKILAKADLEIKILYLTADNKINSCYGKIPIMGFIDLADVSEDNICETNYEIKNMVVKPNSVEEHSIYVEAEIFINCDVYSQKEIQLIQDMYSPKKKVTFTTRQLQVMESKESVRNICNIRETQAIQELNGNKIYDATVKVDTQKQTILNDKIIYEGNIETTYIFSCNEGIEAKKISTPFTFNQEFPGVNAQSNIETITEVETQDFVVTSDEEVEAKVDILFTTSIIKNTQINIIDDVEEEEIKNENTASLVIYYTKKSDTMWKIAKKFSSTVSEIERINGMENVDDLECGKQIFIPRYNG